MKIETVYIESYQADLEREIQVKIPVSGIEPTQENKKNNQSLDIL